MPNYLDHLDLIDPDNHVVVAMLQDRETLALATENASKIGTLDSLNTSYKGDLVGAINETLDDISALDTRLSGDISALDIRLSGDISNVSQQSIARDNALGSRITNEIVYVPSDTLNLDNTGTNDCSSIFANLVNNVGLKAGIYRISNNVTISKQLVFAQGAMLSIDTGVTVTINGNIIAGAYQIFTGNGNVNALSNVDSVCYAEWFGAKVNTNIDNGAIITKALNSFKVVKLGLGVYNASTTISLNDNNVLKGVVAKEYTQNNGGTVINTTALVGIAISKDTFTAINENITGALIEDLTVIQPNDANERLGVKMQYALFSTVRRTNVIGGKFGFWIKGNVHCHFETCTAMRDTSVAAGAPSEYVGFYTVAANIGLAGDNASVYFDKCSVSGAITTNQAFNSYGFAARHSNADLFFDKCETSGLTVGFELIADTNSIIAQNDIHFSKCIVDGASFAGFHITSSGTQWIDHTLELSGCWAALVGSSTGNAFHIERIDGINMVNCIAYGNSALSAIYLKEVRRFSVKGCNSVLGTYGLLLDTCYYGDVTAICKGCTHDIGATNCNLIEFHSFSMNGTDIEINGTTISAPSDATDMTDKTIGNCILRAPYSI